MANQYLAFLDEPTRGSYVAPGSKSLKTVLPINYLFPYFHFINDQWLGVLHYEQPKATLTDHLHDCFGFIPARKIWAFLTSEEVEVCVLLVITTALLMGFHLSIVGR